MYTDFCMGMLYPVEIVTIFHFELARLFVFGEFDAKWPIFSYQCSIDVASTALIYYFLAPLLSILIADWLSVN